MSVGIATSEPIAKRWRVREARIKHVVESYNPAADKLDFLRKIGYFFRIYIALCNIFLCDYESYIYTTTNYRIFPCVMIDIIIICYYNIILLQLLVMQLYVV